MPTKTQTDTAGGRPGDITKHAAGILLAAGTSRRFGRLKQLVTFRKRPLLTWALDSALASDLEKIYLVLGHGADQIRNHLLPYLPEKKLELVHNPDYLHGMGSSLARGVIAAGETWQAYVVMLADQPLVSAGLINSMVSAFFGCRKTIVLPVFKGRRGNPVLFGAKWYTSLCGLKDDFGGRLIVADNPEEVLEIEVDGEHYFRDVDYLEDLKRLEGHPLHSPRPSRSSG